MKKRKTNRSIILIAIVLLTLIPITAVKVKGNTEKIYTKVTVCKGDTLWGIASKYKHPKSDIRKLIYNIRKFNDLNSAVIMPGQELLIPID